MQLPGSILAPLVNKHALAYKVRPDIVMCIILQESNRDPYANRWEPTIQAQLDPQPRTGLAGWKPFSTQVPNLATEKRNRATSWGLMQVLGDTARWCCGITQPFLVALADPDLGIQCGCMYLSRCVKDAGGSYRQALSRYNSGRPDSPEGLAYADAIAARCATGQHLPFFQDNP